VREREGRHAALGLLKALLALECGEQLLRKLLVRGVAAQLDIESKVRKQFLMFSFKRLDPGAFNVGLTGST